MMSDARRTLPVADEGRVELYGLGRCVIETPTDTITPAVGRLFWIAAYLILNRTAAPTRRDLVRLLWPDETDWGLTRRRLRVELSKLRSLGIPVTSGDRLPVR